jgi:hypothetical protein
VAAPCSDDLAPSAVLVNLDRTASAPADARLGVLLGIDLTNLWAMAMARRK